MRLVPLRLVNPLIVALALALSSCGGGSNTAGVGGSGIGGTGITAATVNGNVVQVVNQARLRDPALAQKLLAMVTDWLSAPANAQTGSGPIEGIQVIGGGRITTTDSGGNFELQGVNPSANFVLNFVLSQDQTIALPIGAVPAGSRVTVRNITLNADQGFASADDVEVEENHDSDGDSDSQDDEDDENSGGDDGNSGGGSGEDDGDSVDQDPDSNDEV